MPFVVASPGSPVRAHPNLFMEAAKAALGVGSKDCWQGSPHPQLEAYCCDTTQGPEGRKECWSGLFQFERCCVAAPPAEIYAVPAPRKPQCEGEDCVLNVDQVVKHLAGRTLPACPPAARAQLEKYGDEFLMNVETCVLELLY